jgi:hypothetical protein
LKIVIDLLDIDGAQTIKKILLEPSAKWPRMGTLRDPAVIVAVRVSDRKNLEIRDEDRTLNVQ